MCVCFLKWCVKYPKPILTLNLHGIQNFIKLLLYLLSSPIQIAIFIYCYTSTYKYTYLLMYVYISMFVYMHNICMAMITVRVLCYYMHGYDDGTCILTYKYVEWFVMDSLSFLFFSPPLFGTLKKLL